MSTADTPNSVPIATIAADLGISARRVRQLVRDGALPAPAARGVYSRSACQEAYLRHTVRLDARRLEPQRTRLDRARAEREEFHLERLRGDYVSVAEVRDEAFRRARTARDALEAARSRLAPLLAAESDPMRCDQILAAEIRRVCDELSGGKYGAN